MNLTIQNLQETNVTAAQQQNVFNAFNNEKEEYKVNTPLRMAHFMAQVCHESNGFRVTIENMNYSNPHRLMLVWPRRFTTLDLASQFINNPEKLANFVYASRLGNGNAASGDGFRYRGRGPIQTTGKDNYGRMSRKMFNDQRFLDSPDLMQDLNNGLRAAFIEWTEGNCNALADKDDIKSITKIINGGFTGLDSRKQWLAEWKFTLRNNPA